MSFELGLTDYYYLTYLHVTFFWLYRNGTWRPTSCWFCSHWFFLSCLFPFKVWSIINWLNPNPNAVVSVATTVQHVTIQTSFVGFSIRIRLKWQPVLFLSHMNGLLSCNFLPCIARKMFPVLLTCFSPPTINPLHRV